MDVDQEPKAAQKTKYHSLCIQSWMFNMQMHSVRTDVGALHNPTTTDEFQRMEVADIL